MLTFVPISQYKPGDLSNIIRKSYSRLVKEYPQYWKQEEMEWENFEKQAFAVPEIGKCVFVACVNGKPVGLASYDSRNYPEYGVIGQNCILPKFRGKGFGAQQIRELLRIFQKDGVQKAKVTTSEHPFFEPAQKMYRSLGFREVKRTVGGPDPNYKLIELEVEIRVHQTKPALDKRAHKPSQRQRRSVKNR
jgi:GNAT superfamily N-acetyltransferase